MTTPVQKVYENYLATNIQEDARFDAKKKWVWVPEEEQGYVKAEVTATTGDSYKVLTIHGEEKTCKQADAAEVNPPKFDGVADNSDLAHLSEASVLHNLRLRYADNRIHTNSGLFLVVINPYKNLPIYTDDVIAMYNGKRRADIAPHVFAVADEAYRATRDGKNQSILITGESGAGKTVNTKKVIQYLATIAGRRGSVGQLEEQIISANPILEAFGNAKTIRNDNSSRFGKFIQVQFTKSGFIAGAVIDHYLLEKSRVCKQSKDERNYHIFYQLFAGSSPAAKEQLALTTPDQYYFLNGQGSHGGCFSILDVDDAEEFKALKKSMDCVGISAEDQEAIFRIVAAVLHLGNIQFSQNSSDESFLKAKDPLEKACTLLRVTPDSLQFSLTKKKIKAPGQTIIANLNQEQAAFSKEALAKALYDRMFDWLVKRINKSIDNDAKKANFIGVLDIAGFEIFPDELSNSFEQLCINYTNEKLQQFFNHHMFKLEQEEYLKEKIVWEYEDFGLDLQGCIDLIEKPGCILALLDEECVFPKATDATFLGKLDQKFVSHPNYEKTKLSKSGALLFSVKHYAGKVTYCVNNWLLKNMNPLGDDIVESMQTSLDPFIQSLFWVERSKQIAAGGKKGAQFITISSQYKGQLFTLMTNLSLTDPHFIRCIKPNPEKKAGRLDAKEVLDQLRCNGVLEGIRIARKGYPSRLVFEDFKKRYALLAANKLPADPRAACETILNVVKADKTQYQVGRNKVFFRAGYLGHLEQLRENKQADSAKVIQRSFRKHLFRVRLARRKEEKNSAARIQRNIRAWINRKNAKWTKLYKGIKPLIQPNRVEQELKTTKHELDKMTEAKNQLESQNKSLEDDIKSTKNQLDSAFKDRERLQETKANLENELNDTKEKLAYERSTSMARNQKQEGLISELNAKLTQESANVTNLEKTKKGLEGQVQELQTQLSEEAAAKASLEATRKKLTGEIESLNTRLETEEKEKGELQRGKKKLENDLEDLKAQLAAEKKKNAELERQLLALRADLDQTKADLEKMTSLKNALENAKKQLEAKVADLSDQVENTLQGKTGVEEAKKKLSREIQEIQDQLEAERTNVTKLEESGRALQSKYDELALKNQKEIEAKTAANKQNEALQKDLATLKEQLEAELTAKDGLQKNLKKATADFEELKQKLEGEERGRSTAEQNRKRIETDLKQIQTQLDAALKGKASVEATADTLQSELDELRDQLEFENKAKATLEKQRKQLEGKVEELKEELEAKSAGAEKSSQTLRRELELIREELDAEVEQKRRLEAQNHEYEAQVAELKKKADAVDKAQVEEMKKNFNAQLAALHARLSEEEALKTKFDGEAKKLKTDLKALESRLDTESNEKTQAEKQSKKFENDLKTLTSQLDSERKARADQAANIKKLEAQVAEQSTEYDNLAKAKVTVDRQLKTLQNELAEAHKQVEDEEKSKKKAVADFQAQIRDLQEQLEDESEARRKLEDTRKTLEAEIATIKKNLANADASARAEEAKRVLQAEIDGLKVQLEESAKAKIRAEKDVSKLKDDVATAAAAKDEAENQRKKLLVRIKELEARVEEEKNAASKVGGNVAKVQQELAAAKARADEEAAERAKAATTVKTLQAKISQLEAERNDAETSSGSLKTKIKALEQSINDARKEAELESDLRARVESELKNAKAELDELREHTEGSSSTAQRIERQYKAAQRQVSELEEQLQLAQDKAKEEVSKTKKKMQEQIDDLTTQLEKEVRAKSTATRQQRMLQRELDDTKARLEKLLALHDDA